jgi:biotin carboxyl carrier protein
VIKLKAEVAGKDHKIAIHRAKAEVSAEIDGRHYALQVQDLGAGEYLLIDGYSLYSCRVETVQNHPDDLDVSVRGSSYKVKLIDPKRLRSAQSAGEHDKGSVQILSPMPGKIVRVLVEAGAQVEAGAGIVVVEAMKMQNEMKSPKAGVVVELNAAAGSTVNAGDVLAVVE